MDFRKHVVSVMMLFLLLACTGLGKSDVSEIIFNKGCLIINILERDDAIKISEINVYYNDGRRVFSIGKNDIIIANGNALVPLLDIFKSETDHSKVFLPFLSNREYIMTIKYANRFMDEVTFFVGNPIKEKTIDLLRENSSVRDIVNMLILKSFRYHMNK